MDPNQLEQVLDLRSRKLTPKQIARKLGLSNAEVSKALAQEKEQVRQAEIEASGEAEPIYQCLVNRDCARLLLGLLDLKAPQLSPGVGSPSDPADPSALALPASDAPISSETSGSPAASESADHDHNQGFTIEFDDGSQVELDLNTTSDDDLDVELESDDDLRGGGMTTVLITRRDQRRLKMLCLLIDYWCLGIKSILPVRRMSQSEYEDFVRDVFRHEGGSVEVSLQQAQAVVYGAEAYARELGFYPPSEWNEILPHLGEWNGEPQLTFGRKGRPFYMQGPYDDPEKIIRILEKNVGEGNFDFMVKPF